MKRSSVIHDIKIYLNNGTSTDTRDLERHAQNILTLIEEKGMLPPPREISGEKLGPHQLVEITHDWEPEDVV